MKQLLLFVCLLSSIPLIAQDASQVNTELYKLVFNESVSIKNIRLEFESISPDSRCPKEVNCIRAGEAITVLKVYVDNNFKKELQLTFYPHGISEKLTGILKEENIVIKNLQLFPYPKVDGRQVNSNYFLQFHHIIVD